MNNHKVKITTNDITHGPRDPDELAAWTTAGELTVQGYRKTSNAYCRVTRIDREDWLDFLAKHMHCAVADFYNRDGSGVSDRWRDHYIRCYSKDNHTVHPLVYQHMGRY